MAQMSRPKPILPPIKKSLITAQEAARAAMDYYKEVTGDYNQSSVEEVELSEDQSDWLITLGTRRNANDSLSVIYGKTEIVYKMFKIDAHDGRVISMKIRDV